MTAKAQLIGEVEIRPLGSVKPNKWNPNRMTDAMKASLKHGFINDGWLVSQALLIWGIDDKGTAKNVIIDGEHRWTTAKELSMPEGPMVFINGLSERKAKALTIKMNQKRGEFVGDLLEAVLKDVAVEFDDLGLELGFSDDDLLEMMMPGVPEPAREQVPPDVKGTLPNQRTPITFMVTMQEAPAIEAFFKHATLKTELDSEKFKALVAKAMGGSDGE